MLDPSQQSFFCYGLADVFQPNVRTFILTDPLRFGDRRSCPDPNMLGEVDASPDGQLLVSNGRFYRGASADPALDMTPLETPETARQYGMTRFAPPDGRTFLMAGYSLGFFRRDLLEPFTTVSTGGELVVAAAYAGEHVYALVLQSDYSTARMIRLLDPGIGLEDNAPPVAAFTWTPLEPTDRDEVQFDASSCVDDEPAFDNLSFRWDFESDGVFDTTETPEPIAAQRFRGAGIQNITLEVRDRFGAVTRITNAFTVTAVPDSGEPFGPHTPWRIPMASYRLVFDPTRPVLYSAHLSNQSLVQMDLTTGEIARLMRAGTGGLPTLTWFTK